MTGFYSTGAAEIGSAAAATLLASVPEVCTAGSTVSAKIIRRAFVAESVALLEGVLQRAVQSIAKISEEATQGTTARTVSPTLSARVTEGVELTDDLGTYLMLDARTYRVRAEDRTYHPEPQDRTLNSQGTT